jgi:hypothetical protein
MLDGTKDEGQSYVYLDVLDDGAIFYCGQGLAHRLKCVRRNKKHDNIWYKHNCSIERNRQIIVSNISAELACSIEMFFISMYKLQFDPNQNDDIINLIVIFPLEVKAEIVVIS